MRNVLPNLSSLQNEDAKLVERARRGDVPSFERLFAKHHRRVYNLVYRMVEDEQDAADLTQDTFVRAYNSLHHLDSGEAFYSWVRTIAVNLCRDFFRKRGRTVRTESLDQKVELDGGGEVEREFADWSTNPERSLDRKDMQETVQRAISSLSEEYRTAVILHHIEGMDVKEMADLLQVPVGTVKSRLSRAREDLRRKLGHYVS
ncbi:MAG: RNA polymerase sigma factor [Armatimonadota bacterium]